MQKSNQKKSYWYLDFQDRYFGGFEDYGLFLEHKDFDHEGLFSRFAGDWEIYEETDDVYHDQLKLKNQEGETKIIHIPKGVGRKYCFTDFSTCNIGYYPTIFKAQKRIVSVCHCTSDWDGLGHTSILTIDIETGNVSNQYFYDDDWLWVKKLDKLISGEAENWSNGKLELYLDVSENYLLMNGDYLGKHEASMIFKWEACKWILDRIIPGPKPKFENTLEGFKHGPNSLSNLEFYK